LLISINKNFKSLKKNQCFIVSLKCIEYFLTKKFYDILITQSWANNLSQYKILNTFHKYKIDKLKKLSGVKKAVFNLLVSSTFKHKIINVKKCP